MAIKREYGQEQPYIPMGIFKLRIPFIHFRWEWPEAIQGLFLIAVPMGAIAAHQEMLGIPFDLAILMVTLNSFLYLMHVMLGDPVSPGWITPAIPLILAWGSQFAIGPERIQATIALQLLMAAMFLFLGLTGLAKILVSKVPNSMRAGILLGAAISAAISVFGTRMQGKEISILVGCIVCFGTMFSYKFMVAKSKSQYLMFIAKYGMLPGVVVACILGPLLGEVPMPVLQMGIIPFHRYGELIAGYTIFGVGFPPLHIFIKAIPMALAAYIIAFGDFVFAEVVAKDADLARPDEIIEFNGNRSNIISGMRNLILGIIAPYGAVLAGPLWGATQVAIVERYKQGREGMDSLWGGLFALSAFLGLGTIFYPLISLFKPSLPLGLSLTMLVQAYACCYIAMEMMTSKEERGVAGITAIMLATKGAAWGLATGIVLHILIGLKDEFVNLKTEESKA